MNFNIKTDSRKIKPGDTFVALKTIESDGHKYVEAAIKAGASQVVAMEGSYNVPTIIVDDTREYLNTYLHDNYIECLENMKIMVVTGTNGKTTMAYLMYQALNLLGEKCSYLGTLGFFDLKGKEYKVDNTTPDICEIYEAIVTSYNEGCKYFMLEASSQGIVQHRLDTITYDYAIFTNLTHDHLDFHKTMENYASAKKIVFERLKKGGKAIINIDDQYADTFRLQENINVTYGKAICDYQITDYHFSLEGTTFKIKANNEEQIFQMTLIGEYNIYNILPVIIILKDCGYSFKEISNIIPKLKNGKGRMETVEYHGNLIIVDYAHTPDGMKKMVETVKQAIKGNVYIVFGMVGNRDRTKRPEMARIATTLAKKTIITTSHLNYEDINQIVSDLVGGVINNNYEVILDRKKAIEEGIKLLNKDDALLILGKGHDDYLNLSDHSIHFDDIEEVKKTIKEFEIKQI